MYIVLTLGGPIEQDYILQCEQRDIKDVQGVRIQFDLYTVLLMIMLSNSDDIVSMGRRSELRDEFPCYG